MIINKEIKKIFGNKYYDVVINYIDLIQSVISNYEIVIIMARKAFCFYKAIVEAGLIEENPNCLILSSRVTTYDGLSLIGKKVAVIEDVVVQGNSLFEVVYNDQVKIAEPDIFIAACPSYFPNKFKNDMHLRISNPYVFMNEKELLEFATLITNFIVCEMIPYNVDYPIYKIDKIDIDELHNDLNQCSYCSITRLLNYNESYIEEGVIHFSKCCFSGLDDKKIDDSIVKIRVYINVKKETCIFVPIVILPKLSYDSINKIFKNLTLGKYDNIIFLDNKSIAIKNMYKLLQYGLALSVADFFTNNPLLAKYQIEKINDETTIFPFEQFMNLKDGVEKILLYEAHDIYSSELYNALGFSYDLIFKNCSFTNMYNEEFICEYLSFEDIFAIVYSEQLGDEKSRIIASLMLDVFIDNGIVVPRIILCENVAKRVFKFGEVARLTVHDFILFTNLMYIYADYEGRLLGKTEVEKISVLFFKKYNNCFNSDDNEAESYRICYSKFGPRISCSNICYSVRQGDAFTDKLRYHNLILDRNGKIDIPSYTSDVFCVSDNYCSIFASGLSKIHAYFEHAKAKEPNNPIFYYINTYTRLLTIFSIGNIEKDKITSLIAEVDLIKQKEINKFPILRNAFISFQSIIDGVLSGVWKYFCYIKNELLKDIISLLVEYAEEDNTIYIISAVLGLTFDSSPVQYMDFIDKVGEFLCDVAIFNYYCCIYYKIQNHDDYFHDPYRFILQKEKLSKDLRKKYLKIFSQDDSLIQSYILNKNKEISILANKFVDEFEVFESTFSFVYSQYRDCFALFSVNNESDLPSISKNLKSYQYKQCIIIPVDHNVKVDFLSEMFDNINDVDIKVLYYSANSGVDLLTTIAKYYGNLFLKDIDKFVELIKKLKPSNVCEVIAVENQSNDSFENTISLISDYEFTLTEEQLLQDQKLKRYSYNKKKLEGIGMDVKVKSNTAFIINIENMHIEDMHIATIRNELLELKSKCKDPQVESQINIALNACDAGKTGKLKKALKWLGENASDFLKTLTVSMITEIISSSIQR